MPHTAYIALGANLPRSDSLTPTMTLNAALAALNDRGLTITEISSWYESPPWPPGAMQGQPVYVNGVACLKTSLTAAALLGQLHEIEASFGRNRGEEGRNGARTLDLDVIGFDQEVWEGNLTIPHPRMHLRRFVLEPLVEICPDWRHPLLDQSAAELLAALPETEPQITKIGEAEGI